ncbi:hypothetical protein BFP70_07820 [Thioclava sp. SK-1]|uniref:Hint domain-containing protein n=1 Tax=Thioclava sp. SK-1 TaxID=1889770 RepID=UPI000826414F|nr:Hint domain-containing protein [Thioclava sp. SK-1]OCX66020.1 hypothetical protein BFP70_07820 [Thioclava sp. SK-1]
MPSFGAWQLSDLSWTGPNPFSSNATGNSSSPGNTTFTIGPTADLRIVNLNDNDANFEDGDGSQELAAPMTFNGVSYGSGAAGEVETEYSYIIRPSGSTNPADNITIYVLEFEGDVAGIASSERLFAGQSYDIVAIESNDPVVAYSAMAVCFAAGTKVATKNGPVAVEKLREGMRVQTLDNGYRPVAWAGRWLVNGRGANAPIRFAPGVIGNETALHVSGQHRVLLRPHDGPLAGEEILVAAKALIGLPGVCHAPKPRVNWVHILFEQHEVVFANSARAESLLPAPQALRGIGPQQASTLRQILKDAALPELPARPVVPTGRAMRLLRLHRRADWVGINHPL